MSEPLRKLRSGKEFNPFALGHPTTMLNVQTLLDQVLESTFSFNEPDLPIVLPKDGCLPTSSAVETPASPAGGLLVSLGGASKNEESTFDPALGLESSLRGQPPLDVSKLKAKRARERARKKQAIDSSRGKEAQHRLQFIIRSLEVAHEDFALKSVIHSKSGYVGVPDGGREWHGPSRQASTRLAYLRDVGGYRLVDTSVDASVDYPFVDAAGRVWAVALAEPRNWYQRICGIEQARHRLSERLAHLKPPINRRGNFRSYQKGFSFGMGRIIPMNFGNPEVVKAALTDFFADDHVQALFRFVEGGLRTWFPDHWQTYHRSIQSLQALHPELETPVPGTSFPASTINVGDRVVCDPHRDAGDEAAGVSLNYVDGPFDPDLGGHLVFHEARRIVKLRKGGAILFPSAIVTHENIDVGPEESRFSLTGYFPGGLRRYLEAGGRTMTEWEVADAGGVAAHHALGPTRWELGCARFKTVAELIQIWQEQVPLEVV